MRLPKILFHGTSQVRWQLIKQEKVLRCNMKRHFKADDAHLGYLYFTDSLEEAAICGLATHLVDLRMNQWKEMTQSDARLKNCIVMGIQTSRIKDGFELDPEQYDDMNKAKMPVATLAINKAWGLDSSQIENNPAAMHSTWWRYKGDIPYKYVATQQVADYNSFGQSLIDHMNSCMDRQEWVDLQIPGARNLIFSPNDPEIVMLEKLKIMGYF